MHEITVSSYSREGLAFRLRRELLEHLLNCFVDRLLNGLASRTALPLGPSSRVCDATPRQTPFLVLASDISITSVPFVTAQACELEGMPVAMELRLGAQLGFVAVRSLSVAVRVVSMRSGSLSTFCRPFAVISLSTAATMYCLMSGFASVPLSHMYVLNLEKSHAGSEATFTF